MSSLPDRFTFENIYTGQPPWDIGRPQKAFIDVADQITGSVLDAGCGTGDTALFFAGRGCQVTGIDFLAEPITRAKKKAAERGVTATFLVVDALTAILKPGGTCRHGDERVRANPGDARRCPGWLKTGSDKGSDKRPSWYSGGYGAVAVSLFLQLVREMWSNPPDDPPLLHYFKSSIKVPRILHPRPLPWDGLAREEGLVLAQRAFGIIPAPEVVHLALDLLRPAPLRVRE